jgi:small nuclear ribonucleoprotein (snRNP)-like protein
VELTVLAPVTLELKTHEVYRGYLDEVEDNWNLHITNITRTEVSFFCRGL